jgi:hypothetical protein
MHPFQDIGHGRGRPAAEDLGAELFTHVVDDRQKEVLLGGEEVVKRTTRGLCLADDLVDSRLRVTLAPEQLAGGGDEPVAGCGLTCHGLQVVGKTRTFYLIQGRLSPCLCQEGEVGSIVLE